MIFKEDHIILRKKVVIGLNYWFECTYHFQETFMLLSWSRCRYFIYF